MILWGEQQGLRRFEWTADRIGIAALVWALVVAAVMR